jgi:hypothetical protein
MRREENTRAKTPRRQGEPEITLAKTPKRQKEKDENSEFGYSEFFIWRFGVLARDILLMTCLP